MEVAVFFLGCTSGLFLTFCLGWNSSHLGHSCTELWQSFCNCFSHKKQQNLVKPSCMPTRRAVNFKFLQIFQHYMLYCMQARRSFMFLYDSFIWVASDTGDDGNLFPVWRVTPFRLTFDGSVNSYHSSYVRSCTVISLIDHYSGTYFQLKKRGVRDPSHGCGKWKS